MSEFSSLQKRIVRCTKCPRLVRYLSDIRKKYPTYWCRPVPAFGDQRAKILLLGLAPGRFGSNRTGRMFTGDASGGFLFPTLHEVGLASKADASSRRDGMALEQTIISAVGRCAPPQNKPTPKELSNCRPFWQEEIRLLKHLKVVVALGKIAHDEYVRFQKCRLVDFPFQHGAVHRFTRSPVVLVDTYHPSRQNTNTGKLTKPMFRKVFRQVIELAGQH